MRRLAIIPVVALFGALVAGCGGSSSNPTSTPSSSSSSSSGPSAGGPGTITFGTSYTGNKDSTSCQLQGMTNTFKTGDKMAAKAVFTGSGLPENQEATEFLDSSGKTVYSKFPGTKTRIDHGGCAVFGAVGHAMLTTFKLPGAGTYMLRVVKLSDNSTLAEGTFTIQGTTGQTSSQASSP